jgi:hypothetical protein
MFICQLNQNKERELDRICRVLFGFFFLFLMLMEGDFSLVGAKGQVFCFLFFSRQEIPSEKDQWQL